MEGEKENCSIEEGRFHEMAGLMQKLLTRMDRFNEIMENTTELERNFGSFMKAVEIQSQCVEFPVLPPNQFNYEEWKSAKAAWEKRQKEREDEERLFRTSKKSSNHNNVTAAMKSSKGTGAGGKLKKDDSYLKSIMQKIPMKYRGDPSHKRTIENILKFLRLKKDGQYFNEIALTAHIPKTKCSEYMNLLVKNGDVIRISRKGLLYQLNEERFPFPQ